MLCCCTAFLVAGARQNVCEGKLTARAKSKTALTPFLSPKFNCPTHARKRRGSARTPRRWRVFPRTRYVKHVPISKVVIAAWVAKEFHLIVLKGNKKLILILATPVVVLILCAVGMRLSGIVQLRAYVRHLEQNGEELDYRKLLPPKPTDAENAVVDLVSIYPARDAFEALKKRAPSFSLFSSPGYRPVVFRDESWVWIDYEPNPSEMRTNTWFEFLMEYPRAEGLIDAWQKALEKPEFYFDGDYDNGFLNMKIDEIMAARGPDRWMGIAAMVDLRNRNLDSALNKILTQSRLVGGMENGRMLITEMVRQAVFYAVVDTVWQALQEPGWTNGRLKRLQDIWASWQFDKSMERAWVLERATTYHFLNKMGRSSELRAKQLEKWGQWSSSGLASWDLGPEWVQKYVYFPSWILIWQEEDRLASLQCWDSLINLQRLAITNSWSAVANEPGEITEEVVWKILAGPDELPWYDRMRYLFSSQFLVDKGLILRAAKAQTMRNLGLTAIALNRYRLRNAVWPESLDQLVPDFLAAVPRDPMDGNRLRYQSQDDAGFRLYSVGVDFEDDGGDPRPVKEGVEFKDIWQGRDVVWPMPATNAPSRN